MGIKTTLKISTLLAHNLKTIRESRGLSVVQLAKELGVTRQGIYQIEDGEHWISSTLLEKLCKFYKIEEHELFQINPRLK
jgi:transcriptional regulator with XRE-family HTH domain